MAHVSHHVMDDAVVGADGSSAEGGSAVDGTSVEHVGVSELGEGVSSSAVSNSSGVSGSSFSGGSVLVESDGTSHRVPGGSADLSGTDSVVVGAAVGSESTSSSGSADSHPVDSLMDASSGSGPFGVPVSEGVKASSLVSDGPVESLDGEFVVAGSTDPGR